MIAPAPVIRVPIGTFAADFYPSLKPGLSPRTIEEYCSTVALLVRWVQRPLLVSDFTEDLVRGFLLFRSQSSKSAPTINKDRRQLLALWETAHEFGYHDRPPSRRKIRRWPEPKRIPTAWTIEELERLLSAAKAAPPIRDWTADHWRALILTMYDTSHRIGCLLKAEWPQLLPGGFLHMRAEQMKRKRADAIHKLHPQTVAEVEALPRTAGTIWPWPLSRRYVFEHFGRLLTGMTTPAQMARIQAALAPIFGG